MLPEKVEILLGICISEAKDDGQQQVASFRKVPFLEFLATRPPGSGSGGGREWLTYLCILIWSHVFDWF